MDSADVARLLRSVAEGGTDVDAALRALVEGPFAGADGRSGTRELGFATLDTHRALRTGDPEVVLAERKTPDETVAIVRALREAGEGRPVLATRVPSETVAALVDAFPGALVEDRGRCVCVGGLPATAGRVCVVSAGTSDAPVSAEAAFVARVHGAEVERVEDVGVAGLHRVLSVRDRIDAADCVVVVAGMDGALPSVVGGLVGTPVVAVPTSVGYGASFGGVSALLAMLNSCAPGVAVFNIDNGFGAGLFAARVARRAAAARSR
ncbi:hypothetical protein CLV35_3797 [Motilibacter peucedani]|uniref:PurE domain-containing protein n=1 Tax=Motilibacter peucedani TaxID=598650 RepID=A0A420XJT4_9ACTN|nr:nickel pincer cofactor biosynthesis protein LarB [Motilibacter peucedani]RKS67893.1 hypothetical protein CLV35_3797 [Motilibacter peucedani]